MQHTQIPKKELQALEFSYPDGSMHSQISSLLSSLRYVGIPVTKSWLFGTSCLSFLFRIDDAVNLAPELHELPHRRMYDLVQNVGVQIDGVSGYAEGQRYSDLLAEAWQVARKAMDAGQPCISRGIQFGLNETALVYGYNGDGYFSDCWRNRGQFTRWDRLGEGLSLSAPSLKESNEKRPYGYVDLHRLKPDPSKAVDDATVVREVFELAVGFAAEPARWVRPTTKTGAQALQVLANAMSASKVDGWLFSWSAGMWHECFNHGRLFLLEARDRLNMDASTAFQQAIGSYDTLTNLFERIVELYPFPTAEGLIGESEQRGEAIHILQDAMPIMDQSLEALDSIARALRNTR